MLSLRQFEANMESATYSGTGTRCGEHAVSRVRFQCSAQPSESLPSFIASFAHPVHINDSLFEEGFAGGKPGEDEGLEWAKTDVEEAAALGTLSGFY